MYIVYIDGRVYRSFDSEDEAVDFCELWDGDGEPVYEYAGETGIEDPVSDFEQM